MSRSKRRDSKHRVLRNGESIRADGKYQFKYYVGGKIKFVYSWRLEPTDPVPKGKRPGPSLREMEKQIGKDFDSMIIEAGIDADAIQNISCFLHSVT